VASRHFHFRRAFRVGPSEKISLLAPATPSWISYSVDELWQPNPQRPTSSRSQCTNCLHIAAAVVSTKDALITALGGSQIALMAFFPPAYRRLARFMSSEGMPLALEGAGTVLLIRAAGLVLAYASNVLIVRWLGAEQAGIFFYGVSLLLCLSIASNLGVGTASMRFVAQYRAGGQLALLAGIIKASRNVTLAVSTLVAVVAIIVTTKFATEHSVWTAALVLAFATVPLVSLVLLNADIATGLGWTAFANVPEQLLRNIALIGGVWVYAACIGKPNAAVAAAIMLASYFLLLGYQAVGFGNRLRIDASVRPRTEAKVWFETSLPLWLTALSYIVIERVDILLIGYLLTPTDVAVYTAASRTSTLVLM
jgi:O-antigen/teichoic acid export membrane protein